jgi:hypothetical protein
MTISARAAGYGRSPQRMACSPSIEQFALRQNARPLSTFSTFWAFSLREAFRFEMAGAVWPGYCPKSATPRALRLRWRNPEPEANRLALALLRSASE